MLCVLRKALKEHNQGLNSRRSLPFQVGRCHSFAIHLKRMKIAPKLCVFQFSSDVLSIFADIAQVSSFMNLAISYGNVCDLRSAEITEDIHGDQLTDEFVRASQ